MLLSVDIIMATYNGEKYIENQILSLMQQSHKNWTLYVHDDGSTDRTIEIIKKYIAIDNRIVLIDDDLKGLKVGKNFLHTLRYSKSDYAIFCDQDDIWLEKKVEKLLNAIVENDCLDMPVMVYCDGYSWTEKDGCINQDSIAIKHAQGLRDFIFYNGGYQGCSIIMNKKLIDMACSYNGYIYHHDDLVSLIAHTFGKVKFIPDKLMLYRQHQQAVTGIKSYKKKPIDGLFNNVGFVVSKQHHKAKLDFYNIYKNDMSESNKKVFQSYLSYCNKGSKFLRLMHVILSPLTLGGSKSKLLGKTLFQRLFNV